MQLSFFESNSKVAVTKSMSSTAVTGWVGLAGWPGPEVVTGENCMHWCLSRILHAALRNHVYSTQSFRAIGVPGALRGKGQVFVFWERNDQSSASSQGFDQADKTGVLHWAKEWT